MMLILHKDNEKKDYPSICSVDLPDKPVCGRPLLFCWKMCLSGRRREPGENGCSGDVADDIFRKNFYLCHVSMKGLFHVYRTKSTKRKHR